MSTPVYVGGQKGGSTSAIEIGQRNLPPANWEAVAKVLGIDRKEFAQMMLRYTCYAAWLK
jgi:hypothetical protein